MSERKAIQSLLNLERSLTRLGEALKEKEENSLMIDGTIQRFEFVIELFWKSLKRLLEEEGIHTNTPRESLKQAYQAGWLHDENIWLQMLRDHNETSHVYDEEAARRIYDNIKQYYPHMVNTYELLKRNYIIE
ncbi:HI0074 family nucleotidyltransferase substrate-binding subunit [Aneurinibacillus terranovensis]|uniref:HI0074 family nucleotidyltransferase substrate-binding subunit n=1 Tax=Aneurinibacillus terranovensis TaxID=278991 RepID=UPI0004865A15|nr:HI0074 family nucleotidyltransferase substrate-binding subunit [Aneurinibacillus terranovensis]